MKLNRLFEIVYILINKRQITAKELAERFEVSQRTIYRDIDVLSQCGIPIYAAKGKGGGIRLIEGYKIDKAMLTDTEQKEILSALQGISAAKVESGNTALNKLSAFFNAGNTDWIEIDFSSFSANSNWKQNFQHLKQSIINLKRVRIQYASLKGETSTRTIEPIKLIFKGVGWYLHAYCKIKGDYRMFKLNRILSLQVLDESFAPHTLIDINTDHSTMTAHDEEMIIKVSADYAYRIYDDYSSDCITQDESGDYIVKANTYEEDWMVNYILSFGDKAEVLKPVKLRNKIADILKRSAKKYL